MSEQKLCAKGLHPSIPENMVSNGNRKRSCKLCRAEARAAMGPCQIDGCSNPYRSHGWCQTHYERWRKYGDPNRKPMTSAEIIAEIEWLIEGGMSTFYIASVLNRDRENLGRLLYRHNRHELAVRFERVEDAA